MFTEMGDVNTEMGGVNTEMGGLFTGFLYQM